MPAFLNGYPLDWTDPRLRELADALSAVIYRDADIELLAVRAGIAPGSIAWNQPAYRLWYDVLNEAAGILKIPQLLRLAGERRPALAPRINELVRDDPILGATVPADHPAAMAATDGRWKNFTLERQIFDDQETLLDIVFLQHGLDRARSVCRLTVSIGGKRYHGTGFRVGRNTLLTNHHVLYDWTDDAAKPDEVIAEFGYELDAAGVLGDVSVVHCAPESIVGDRDHDCAVISVATPWPDDVPILPLDASATVDVDDRVYIIQHPKGLPKKIAMHHNLVKYVDDDVVQYWTDTEAGSSGSPVFDDSWRVVALHHQWVRSAGNDGVAYRNQGRVIGRVADRLVSLGVDFGRE